MPLILRFKHENSYIFTHTWHLWRRLSSNIEPWESKNKILKKLEWGMLDDEDDEFLLLMILAYCL